MISGHRRLHAAGLAGLSMIPAIVREMDDDTAVLAMVDANIQREELLPSEKAFAFKMKMEALRRQGERNDLTLGRDVPKWSHDEIGESHRLFSFQRPFFMRRMIFFYDFTSKNHVKNNISKNFFIFFKIVLYFCQKLCP